MRRDRTTSSGNRKRRMEAVRWDAWIVMWPCSWGLAPCVSPLPDLAYHTEKPFTVCLVEQTLYRVEHVWPVCRCKITLSYHMFKAPLLSPLKFSVENQQPNSIIPGWSVGLRADLELACMLCVCIWVWGRYKRWKGEIQSLTAEKHEKWMKSNS